MASSRRSADRTPPFQGGDAGSNPVGSTDELPERIMGSVAEAASMLGVGVQTVRDSIRKGTFPEGVQTRRFGDRVLVNLPQLRQWCETEAVAS